MENNKSKKIAGAVFSSAFIGTFFLAMIVSITMFQFTSDEVLPWGPYIFTMCVFGIPLLGIIINLVYRISEILGGEEDDASKY